MSSGILMAEVAWFPQHHWDDSVRAFTQGVFSMSGTLDQPLRQPEWRDRTRVCLALLDQLEKQGCPRTTTLLWMVGIGFYRRNYLDGAERWSRSDPWSPYFWVLYASQILHYGRADYTTAQTVRRHIETFSRFITVEDTARGYRATLKWPTEFFGDYRPLRDVEDGDWPGCTNAAYGGRDLRWDYALKHLQQSTSDDLTIDIAEPSDSPGPIVSRNAVQNDGPPQKRACPVPPDVSEGVPSPHERKLRDRRIGVENKSRLSRADYCSPLIEVRRSDFGGDTKRGIFAKEEISQGSVIVVSTAIAHVYRSKLATSAVGSLASIDDLAERVLAEKISSTVEKERIRNLSGGPFDCEIEGVLPNHESRTSSDTNWELRLSEILQIVHRNVFYTCREHKSGTIVFEAGLYDVPSYFNHSCMPNALYEHHGEKIIIRTMATIPRDSEIFFSYIPDHDTLLLEEREILLHQRRNPFECQCVLCFFEREYRARLRPAYEITQHVLRICANSRVQGAIDVLRVARQSLYKYFNKKEPLRGFKIIRLDLSCPRSFVFAKLLSGILWELVLVLDGLSLPTIWSNKLRCLEVAGYCQELHAIVKGNLCFWRCALRCAPLPALCVSYVSLLYGDVTLGRIWLKEAERLRQKCVGERHDPQYSRTLKIVTRRLEQLEQYP